MKARPGLCPNEGAVSLQETRDVPELCLPGPFAFSRSILSGKGHETGTQVVVT